MLPNRQARKKMESTTCIMTKQTNHPTLPSYEANIIGKKKAVIK